MMKTLIVVFACLLAGNLTLDCEHSRTNVRGGEGGDMSMKAETCKSEDEKYCVYVWGKDHDAKNNTISFSYRGCYTEFELMKEHYHDPGCPKGGSIINQAIVGNMTCCTGNLCNNPASSISFSSIILVLPISVLFYVFSW